MIFQLVVLHGTQHPIGVDAQFLIPFRPYVNAQMKVYVKLPPGALLSVARISHVAQHLSCLDRLPLLQPLGVRVQMSIVKVRSALGSLTVENIKSTLQTA